MVKKARLCEAKLLILATAFKRLMSDENFVLLLRAEGVTAMPKCLAQGNSSRGGRAAQGQADIAERHSRPAAGFRVRQIEMAELMVMMNDFTKGYADALFVGTPVDQLANPERGKKIPNLSAEEVARMEQELESLERDFKAIESNYGENMLNLTVIVGYVRKLLGNAGIVKFLRARHSDLCAELERVASNEAV